MPKCAADAATCGLLGKFEIYIINPIFVLLLAGAGLLFIWGVVEFLLKLRKGDKADEGRDHMLWGLVGLFIIVSTMAILKIIANTVQGFFP